MLLYCSLHACKRNTPVILMGHGYILELLPYKTLSHTCIDYSFTPWSDSYLELPPLPFPANSWGCLLLWSRRMASDPSSRRVFVLLRIFEFEDSFRRASRLGSTKNESYIFVCNVMTIYRDLLIIQYIYIYMYISSCPAGYLRHRAYCVLCSGVRRFKEN